MSEGEAERYAWSWHDAVAQGVDTRNFKRVKTLPTSVKLTAIMGVWGDNQNLRCLFITEDGEPLLRHCFWRGKGPEYWIPELERSGRDLRPGEEIIIEAEGEESP